VYATNESKAELIGKGEDVWRRAERQKYTDKIEVQQFRNPNPNRAGVARDLPTSRGKISVSISLALIFDLR